MGRILLLAVLLLTAQACVTTAKEMTSDEPTSEAVQALLWVEAADARSDAERALQVGDYRLFVPAGRGRNVPGLAAEDGARYRQTCGEKLLPGTTDFVESDRHLQLLQAVYRYAGEYNRVVVTRCGAR